mgnify:CR=1 FL=1
MYILFLNVLNYFNSDDDVMVVMATTTMEVVE